MTERGPGGENPKKPSGLESLKKVADTVTEAWDGLESPTRRKILLGGAAAGATAAVGGLGVAVYEGLNHQKHETFHRGKFSTGELANTKVGGLFADFLGLPEGSRIPEEFEPDFGAIMEELWQKKLARVRSSKKHADHLPNILHAKEHFDDSYKKAWQDGAVTSQDFPALLEIAGKTIQTTRDAFDWDRFGEREEYKHPRGAEELRIVRKMTENITPEMLLAYSVTELMPYAAKHDEKNEKLQRLPLEVYELLLKHAGTEFLLSVPALYDERLSVGMFQFTSDALFDDGHKKEGASVINEYISDEHAEIPSSVIQLNTAEEQFRAAYLFAIYNLAALVRISGKDGNEEHVNQRMQRLSDKAAKMKVGLLQYIASAHHNPGEAVQGFIGWADADFQGHHSDFCGDRIRDYVRFSHANYELLQGEQPQL